MLTCIICRFETELDDAVAATPRGRCVCLRCYNRETGAERRMPKDLRRAVVEALAALEAA
jgi:hypothetical protein